MNGAVARLSHVALRTTDVSPLRNHYVDVIGLSPYDEADGAVFLASGGLGPALELRPESSAGLDHIAFEVAPAHEEELLAHLGRLAVEISSRSDAEPGLSRVHQIVDAEDNAIHLCVVDERRAAATPSATGIVPQKLGHVATRTRSAEAVTDFYERALGFRWSDWMGDFFVFLRCNTDHHAVNFVNASRPGQLHHLAFELADVSRISVACDALAAEGIPLLWGPGRHGIGHNVFTYHSDPDGNVVELFCDIDRMASEDLGYFEPRPWHADRPQKPKRWIPDPSSANTWGPAPPEGFMA